MRPYRAWNNTVYDGKAVVCVALSEWDARRISGLLNEGRLSEMERAATSGTIRLTGPLEHRLIDMREINDEQARMRREAFVRQRKDEA